MCINRSTTKKKKENMKMTSPLVPKSQQLHQEQKMSFSVAFTEAVKGEKIKRLSWPDATDYIFVRGEVYHIHNANGDHRLILSTGDVLGDDWVIARTVN